MLKRIRSVLPMILQRRSMLGADIIALRHLQKFNFSTPKRIILEEVEQRAVVAYFALLFIT